MEIFKCDTCNYETKDKSNMTKHNKSKKHLLNTNQLIKEKKTYKCKECSFETSHNSNYHRHMLSHSEHPTAHYRFHCKACEVDMRDTCNYFAHVSKASHVQNVKEKFPEAIKKRMIGTVEMAHQSLDVSKKHLYIIDKRSNAKSQTKATVKAHAPTKKATKPKARINIKTMFEFEYFDLSDSEKKQKVETMMGILSAEFVEAEFPDVLQHIEAGDFDEAYGVMYNLFTQEGIKDYMEMVGENLDVDYS